MTLSALTLLTMAFVGAVHATVIPEVNLRAQQTTPTQKSDRVQKTVITRQEINQSPVATLGEYLKRQQSIVRLTNNSGDSSQAALSLRGFGDNAAANSLILVDGFPLTNPTLLAPNFNSIALTDIERVEIIQGSEGTLWGDQAVGGVINIITRHPEKFIADANIGLGSFNKSVYNLLVGGRLENGLFFKAVGFRNNVNNYRKHNRQADDMLTLQSGIDYARGTLSLNLKIADDKVLFPGGLTQEQYAANPRQATNASNFSQYQSKILQLLSKHTMNDHWLLETRLAHQKLDGDGFINSVFNRSEWENTINPKLSVTIKNNKFTLGYYGLDSAYSLSNKFVHERATAEQQHFYAQAIIPLANKFDFTFGGREAWQSEIAEKTIGDRVSSFNRIFVSEQGISFRPTSEWQFYVRRDGNFRFPKANEATWTPTGTTKLQMQTGVSYEAGVVWKRELQKTQVSIYDLRLQNEIGFDPTPTDVDPFGTFNNFDPTRRLGITVTETLRLTPKTTIDSQVNLVNPQFTSGPYSGNQIPAVPTINANAGLTYAWTDNWRANYAALYTGKRYASEDMVNIGGKLPDYWLHSLALQYVRPAFEISFEVNNIFNQKYSTYTLFNTFDNSKTYYPGAGRNYLLTFKTSFD